MLHRPAVLPPYWLSTLIFNAPPLWCLSACPPACVQLVLRLNSHDYPQLAAGMIIPVLASLWQRLTSRGEEEF